MLHEILLSLSGHPSPLLRTDADPEADARAGITPPERHLLAEAARLSDVHIRVTTHAAQIANSHPSTVCRAVASSIEANQLAAFQKKVLDVENSILQDDPALVGAYNIVPLTAVMGEFRPWVRTMEWLWGIVRFIADVDGATLINRLRDELQSGYRDVEEAAMSLVRAAESSWLQQMSVWVLNGRLPMFGGSDFFVQKTKALEDNGAEDFILDMSLSPTFVTPATAASILFIGKSLNRARLEQSQHVSIHGIQDFPAKIAQLASLPLPLKSSDLSATIAALRRSLAETTLQKLLPLSKIVETLQILRGFFLLGRGEFAMALIHEADERTRNRWRRADNLAYDKPNGLKNITVKEGEVAAVLSRTWAVLVSRQGQYDEEDDQVEIARGMLQLHLEDPKTSPASLPAATDPYYNSLKSLQKQPFNSLLFSAPASLSIDLPSPLDMVLSHADLHTYSMINAYLLALRRAHSRLTDLWKITSLRRHYPSPPGADDQAIVLRERWSDRLSVMRSSWTTASAAIFFLAETEAFLQTEIVAVLWDGFYQWMTGNTQTTPTRNETVATKVAKDSELRLEASADDESGSEEDGDLWLDNDGENTTQAQHPHAGEPSRHRRSLHDPQTISSAHKTYLHTLTHRLLLTQPTFTQPLHTLLVHIDYLVSHVQRLHSIFTSIDLETDAGVVDAFVDLGKEEQEVQARLRGVEGKVKHGIEEVVAALRALESDEKFLGEWEGQGMPGGGGGGGSDGAVAAAASDTPLEEERYVPARVGGVNRLLMKLDFGSWF